MNRIYTVSKHLNDVAVMQKYVVVIGDHLSVNGFVPSKNSKKFKKILKRLKMFSLISNQPIAMRVYNRQHY
ncbi:hypothetical protein SD457_18490 [Coprobacillaceae bacterium CR2/5/TPMF4]|nr:hypothetical protein SD457_18490 [Coprobacillaceae bacterium CR2/5/TPMF4]